MPAMALTDHGVMYGAIEFYQKAKDAGIKPIIGVEAYMARRTLNDREAGLDSKPYHLTMLARNLTGYRNLIKMVSVSHLEGFYYKPRMDKELLGKHSEGITVLTGCLNSELARTILGNKQAEAEELLKYYMDTVGRENVFLEVQDHPALKDQITVNQAVKKLGEKLNLPLVATGDSHYLTHDDQDAHEILLAVSTGKDVDDADRMTLKDVDLSVATPEEMKTRFSAFGEAVENTLRVAENVDLEFELGKNILPKFDIPVKNKTANEYFVELLDKGFEKKYKSDNQEARERLEYEKEVIKKMGFEDYFLIVQDFVNWSKDQGIIVGPGRGSAAGSIIAYILGITNLDPLKYGLLFERFLNPDRISMPDIDIDFADDRRDEVLRYVQEKYGEERVGQIITFGTMAARGSIRDVARSLGMSFADGDRIAKLIPGKPGTTLKESLEGVAELKEIYDSEPNMKHLLDMAMKLEGVARHASTHACGVIIADKPLTDYVPLATNQKGPMKSLTQFSMVDCETVGLLKMDFLGLSNLTIIKNALRIIKKRHNKEIDIDNLPLDDKPTYELLSRGETTGVFQLESGGMKRYLKELKPSQLEDVIAMAALYRPGPMEFIPDFIDGKHGRKEVVYIHESVEEVLKPTYGVMVYQEQMMSMSRILAGFTGGEADTLRKGVAKKIMAVLEKIQPKFVAGCEKVGYITRDQAENLWQEWLAWAKYGFNKSHAACYALIAYQTAYLKAHYPAEFMAALMTSDINNLDRISIEINEAEKMGLHVLPPSVNESFVEFGVVGDEGKEIRFGLAAIKNIGDKVSENIVEDRKKNGSYQDLDDFCSRLGTETVNKKTLENLAMSGAFDCFAERQQILDNVDLIIKFTQAIEKEKNSAQVSLFGGLSESAAPTTKLQLAAATPATKKQRLAWEKELLSVYVSEHPLDSHKEKIEKIDQPINTLNSVMVEQQVTIGGIITQIKQITTKKGDPMAFAKFEDFSGEIELVVFPNTFKEKQDLWQLDQVLMVRGKMNDRDGERKILVSSAQNLEDAKIKTKRKPTTPPTDPARIREIHLTFDASANRALLMELKEFLAKAPGAVPVHCVIEEDGNHRFATNINVKPDQELINKLFNSLGREKILLVR